MTKSYKIVSIDVGIINLAILEIDAFIDNTGSSILNNSKNYDNEDGIIKFEKVSDCHLINITELVEWCTDKACELHHDKCISDYMSHLYKIHGTIFEKADKILIERQPITGLVAVQESILTRYRDKAVLVSPNGMHKYYYINNYNYDKRKERVTHFASDYLNGFDLFNDLERKHDLADAFCLAKYWISLENEKRSEIALEKNFKKTHGDFLQNIEKYRYTGEDF